MQENGFNPDVHQLRMKKMIQPSLMIKLSNNSIHNYQS
jgi:hypothetical protein